MFKRSSLASCFFMRANCRSSRASINCVIKTVTFQNCTRLPRPLASAPKRHRHNVQIHIIPQMTIRTRFGPQAGCPIEHCRRDRQHIAVGGQFDEVLQLPDDLRGAKPARRRNNTARAAGSATKTPSMSERIDSPLTDLDACDIDGGPGLSYFC